MAGMGKERGQQMKPLDAIIGALPASEREAVEKRFAELRFAPFDASDYLDSEELIAEYLSAAAQEGHDVFMRALGNVAKARGMTAVAQASGLGRESLYKALAPGAHPRHDTIAAVVRALGLSFTIAPLNKAGAPS